MHFKNLCVLNDDTVLMKLLVQIRFFLGTVIKFMFLPHSFRIVATYEANMGGRDVGRRDIQSKSKGTLLYA